MKYLDKDLSEHSLSKLEIIWLDLLAAENKREEASKHEKFKNMEFPPPNPKFLELKLAIEEEIRKKKTNVA